MRPKYEFAYKFTHRGDGIPCKCKEVAAKYIELFKSSTKENPKDQELEDIRNEYNNAKDQCTVCKPRQEPNNDECICGFVEDYLYATTTDDDIPFENLTPELLLPLDLEWRYWLRHCAHCRLGHSRCIWSEMQILYTPRPYSTVFHCCIIFKRNSDAPEDAEEIEGYYQLYLKCMSL